MEHRVHFHLPQPHLKNYVLERGQNGTKTKRLKCGEKSVKK